MGETMRYVQFTGGGRVELREKRVPDPGPGEALVRIAASAICGSELGALREGLSGEGRNNGGHEMVGVVERANSTRRAGEGQRVGLQVLYGCGHCLYCLRGDPKHCRNGMTYLTNGHADYVLAPDMCLVPLPDDLDWEASVLLCGDTLGTPYHALKRLGGVCAGEWAAVFGGGPIGLGCLAWLTYHGARVIVSEPSAYRRALAERLGAELTVDPGQEDAVARVREATDGGADLCLDCSPEPQTLADALDAARVQGRVAWIGEKATATVNPSGQVIHKELHMAGAWYFTAAEFYEQLAHYRRGLSPSGLITHRFPLADAPEAYRLFAARQAGKVILTRP